MNARMRRIALGSLIGLGLMVSGCYSSALCLRQAMTECKVEKSVCADFVAGSKLVIRDCQGAVRISTGEVTDCRAAATVFVHAPTKREAQEIAEQVQLAAEPNEGMLIITIKKPPMPRDHRFVSADLDVVIPRQAQVDCETDFGRITLVGIEGDIKAATQWGRVVCENTKGSLDLETQWGRIIGREIVSDHLVVRSQKGAIDISCAAACPAEMVADVSTQWGKVRFKAPPRYQGVVEAESELGSVKLDTPVDVRGTTEKTLLHGRVSGRIGSGQGNLRLSTNLGSVIMR